MDHHKLNLKVDAVAKTEEVLPYTYRPNKSLLLQKKISEGAQKILWASRIIDTIITAPPLKDSSSLSMK